VVSSLSGPGGLPATLQNQFLANRQQAALQRIQDLQAERQARDDLAEDTRRRNEDRTLIQDLEAEERNLGNRRFAQDGAGTVAGRRNPFLGPDSPLPNSPLSGDRPGPRVERPGGGFGAFGNPIQSEPFFDGGLRGVQRGRPSSPFIAQALGQEDRPEGERPTVQAAAGLYQQTQDVADQAVLRARLPEPAGPTGLVPEAGSRGNPSPPPPGQI